MIACDGDDGGPEVIACDGDDGEPEVIASAGDDGRRARADCTNAAVTEAVITARKPIPVIISTTAIVRPELGFGTM